MSNPAPLTRFHDPAFRREAAVIALLCLIMLLKGALWSLAFPLWQGPDEDDHYAVVQFIAETGRLPDAADDRLPDEVALSRIFADVGRLDYAPEQRQPFSDSDTAPGELAFQTVDPALRRSFDLGTVGKLMTATPLWYLLATPVYHLFADGDLLVRAHALRLFAVLVSSPIVVIAWLITARLFPHNRPMRLTIPFLVTFHPMITAISAVVSVDGLFFVVYSLLLLLGMRIVQHGLDRATAIAIGLLFAAGLLIKPTINGVAPVIAFAVLLDWLRRPAARRAIFGRSLLMVAVMLPPIAWWMVRSLRINNDLLYFNPVEKGHRILQQPFYDYTVWQHALDYWQSVFGGIFVTWWAHFGWLDTPIDPRIYTVLRLLTLLALVGLFLRLGRWLRQRPASRPLWQETTLWLWAILALAVLLPVVLLQGYDLTFWWEYGNGRGLQGRYWLGTVIPMLLLWCVGLLAWLPARLHTSFHLAVRAGMVVLNSAGLLLWIVPRYFL
jgi:hypothetical protein